MRAEKPHARQRRMGHPRVTLLPRGTPVRGVAR